MTAARPGSWWATSFRTTESPARVVAWFSDHADAVRIYAWTATFGTLALAVVAGIVRSTLPPPFRDVFLLGAAAFIVETAVQAWCWAALALHANSLDAATARTILDVAIFWGPILTGATITMMAPVTLLAIRRREVGLPRWLGVLGVIAIVEQTIETVTIFGSQGFTEPGGAMNIQLGAGLVIAWVAVFAIWTVFRSDTHNRAAAH